MEAPIPASSLIHSATLVSAGIYLLGRLYPAICLYPTFMFLISYIGLFTAVFGGVIACYQTDLKKILAYSTISHCGVLIFLTMLPNNTILYLYLVTHGVFKSLSFMFSGKIISKMGGYQDVRRMGGLFKTLRLEFFMLFFSLSGLASLPFSIGFFSKALFMSNAVIFTPTFTLIMGFSLLLTGLCGVVYFSRILFFVFFTRPSYSNDSILKAEASYAFSTPTLSHTVL